MKQFLLFVILSLTMLRAASAADFSFADCAPDETLLFAEVTDRQGLERAWQRTPYARLWADPDFAPFWKPLKKRMDDGMSRVREKQGIGVDELKRLVPGRICVFMSDLRYEVDMAKQTVYKEMNTGFIARIEPGSEDRVRRLIEDNVIGRLPGNAERSAEEFRGVRIYTSVFLESQVQPAKQTTDGGVERQGPKEPTDRDTTESGISVPPTGTAEFHYEYAFVDDVCFLLEGQRAFMKKVLSNYFAARDGSPAPTCLSATENYRRFLREIDIKAQIIGYANIQRYLQQLSADPNWKRTMAIDALALSELRGAGAALALSEEATDLRVTLTTSPHPQGLASVLIREAHNDFASLRLTPDDAWGWSSSNIDFEAFYKRLKQAIFQANPAIWQGIAGALMQVEQQTGTSFENDLVAALGGEFATYSRPPAGALASLSQPGMTNPSQPRQVLFIGLKRAQGFAPKLARFLEVALSMGSPVAKARFQTEEFQSSVIYRLDAPAPPTGPGADAPNSAVPRPRLAFTVTPSHLLISADPAELRSALRLAAGQGGANLESRESFRRAVQSIRPEAMARSWQDSARVVKQLASTMQTNPMLLMLLGDVVAPTAMPDPEAFARHFGHAVGAGYASSDAYRAEIRILYPSR